MWTAKAKPRDKKQQPSKRSAATAATAATKAKAEEEAAPCDTRLSSTGYSLSKAELGDARVQALKRELTVTPLVLGQGGQGGQGGNQSAPPPSFSLWLEGATRLYVPKFYGLQRFGVPARCTVPDGASAPHLAFSGSLRAEQMEPVRAFMEAAGDPARMGGILSLPCGSGKTVIALHLIAAIKKKTLIVVHKDFLLQQWRERMETFLPAARIGTVKAQVIDVADKDVIIASLQSLSMKTYPPELFADVGLLVIDEVHRTGTEVFSRALYKTNIKRSLGLSATVKRKDGMTKVFEWFIGDVVYAITKSEDVVNVHLHRFGSADQAYCEEPVAYGGKLNTSRMVNNITAYPPRTALLVRCILDAVARDGRRVLVLSDRKRHLVDIARGVMESGRSVSTGYYIGGMKPAELTRSQDRDVILATFSFASEGFDVPGLDTLVLASPKTDIEQSVGRILRQRPDQRRNVPLIIDVLDGIPVFAAQAKRRRAYYSKRKYAMRVIEWPPQTVHGVEKEGEAEEYEPEPEKEPEWEGEPEAEEERGLRSNSDESCYCIVDGDGDSDGEGDRDAEYMFVDEEKEV